MGYSSLNSVAIKELASNIMFENIVQDILIVPGKGADFKYCQDLNAGKVSIQRTKMVDDGRVLGASINGGFMDSAYGSLESQIFDIDLNIVATRPIVVPATAEIMNGNGMLLKSVLANIPKQIARVVNLSYLATCVTAIVNKGITATGSVSVVTYAQDSDYITKASADTAAGAMAAFSSALSNLGSGDTANGFDTFEGRNSQLFAKPSYLNLLRNNVGILASSNLGQEMISSGSFNAFDTAYTPSNVNGLYGEIYGVLVYSVGDLFNTSAGWLGLRTIGSTIAATSSTALAHINALLVCGDAIGGGIDLRSEVKVIDAKGGQGWEVQPNGRCGWKIFSEKGVQLITDSTGITSSDFKVATSADGVITWTKNTEFYAPLNRA